MKARCTAETNMLKIINRKLSPVAFEEYMKNLRTFRRVDKVIFHHTSSPVESWQGSASMLHYWNLYRSRGWRSGPHIFIAPDGIWIFTPITKKGTGATKEANRHAIHVEIVGRYFDGPPTHPEICLFTAIVAAQLIRKFSLIPERDFHNHYFYDKLSNCSKHVTGEWVIDQMKIRNLY